MKHIQTYNLLLLPSYMINQSKSILIFTLEFRFLKLISTLGKMERCHKMKDYCVVKGNFNVSNAVCFLVKSTPTKYNSTMRTFRLFIFSLFCLRRKKKKSTPDTSWQFLPYSRDNLSGSLVSCSVFAPSVTKREREIESWKTLWYPQTHSLS